MGVYQAAVSEGLAQPLPSVAVDAPDGYAVGVEALIVIGVPVAVYSGKLVACVPTGATMDVGGHG